MSLCPGFSDDKHNFDHRLTTTNVCPGPRRMDAAGWMQQDANVPHASQVTSGYHPGGQHHSHTTFSEKKKQTTQKRETQKTSKQTSKHQHPSSATKSLSAKFEVSRRSHRGLAHRTPRNYEFLAVVSAADTLRAALP